MLLER
jgi:hypothetical protein